MLTTIQSEKGVILIDGEYGNIIMISGDWQDGETPRQFHAEEYRSANGVHNLPRTLDISDIGYIREDGISVPPSRPESRSTDSIKG